MVGGWVDGWLRRRLGECMEVGMEIGKGMDRASGWHRTRDSNSMMGNQSVHT
jgi:hypothetical protein